MANDGMQVIDLTGSQFEGGDDDLDGLSELPDGLEPEPSEVAALDQAMAEVADDEAAADLAVAEELDAIELAQELEADRLADEAAEFQRLAAARAMARQYARAAAQAGDYELGARTYADLANDPRGASVVELAQSDAGDQFGACGPMDPETLICMSRYHAHGCLHNGTAEADAAGELPGGRDPVRAENPVHVCDQAIFVDRAAGENLSSDAVLLYFDWSG